MFARTITLRISPHAVDQFIAFVRDDALPMVTQLDGCVGLSLLVDRDACRCITTSAWETREALRASEERVKTLREQTAEMFAAAPEIEVWEIGVLHRAQRTTEGACARLTWSRTEPANLDSVLDAYRSSLMPWWEQTPGFRSNSLLIDRKDGRLASTVVFDSREAMSHTRDQFTTLREEFAQRMKLEILEVAEFDLPLAHLRAPETV